MPLCSASQMDYQSASYLSSGYAAPDEAMEGGATEAEHEIVMLVAAESRYLPRVTIAS